MSKQSVVRKLKRYPVVTLMLVLVLIAFVWLYFSYEQVTHSSQIKPIVIGKPASGDALAMQYQPVAEIVRQSVLQSMAEFRAVNKQLQPDILIRFQDESETTIKIAEKLNAWLNQNQLQTGLHLMESSFVATNKHSQIIIYHALGQTNYAQRFVKKLAPYINGAGTLVPTNLLDPGQLRILFSGNPAFSTQGKIFFLSEGDEVWKEGDEV